MSLQTEVDALRQEIRTDAYPMSIGEWASLYESNEMDIHPEFQRFFRWSDTQKTALIESIILGIPIPSIFVSQRSDGVWDVVDGLQRLSTIFQFLGILKDEHGKLVPPLVLKKTGYLPSLDGVSHGKGGKTEMPSDLKLIFKRTKINASIILRESEERTKYDLFQRLNTGGSVASDQEVRNCISVMIDKEFYRWLRSLSKNQNFIDTVSLSDRPLSEAYDDELVLRFLILHNIDTKELKNVGDVGVFLTDRMRKIASDVNYNKNGIKSVFEKTFQILNDSLSDSSFKRYNIEKNRYMGAFLISQFEVAACGIGYNLSQGIMPSNSGEKIADLWKMPDYTNWTGSGITAARRLPRLIPLGRELFSK